MAAGALITNEGFSRNVNLSGRNSHSCEEGLSRGRGLLVIDTYVSKSALVAFVSEMLPYRGKVRALSEQVCAAGMLERMRLGEG